MLMDTLEEVNVVDIFEREEVLMDKNKLSLEELALEKVSAAEVIVGSKSIAREFGISLSDVIEANKVAEMWRQNFLYARNEDKRDKQIDELLSLLKRKR